MPWIHADDVVGLYLAALDDERCWRAGQRHGARARHQQGLLRALGRALHRPAFAPVPAFAIRLLYGEMAEIVTKGQRVIPGAPVELGYAFAHPDLDEALRAAPGAAFEIAARPWPCPAASPAISASRGLWRRCHGLR